LNKRYETTDSNKDLQSDDEDGMDITESSQDTKDKGSFNSSIASKGHSDDVKSAYFVSDSTDAGIFD